ncbi:MAG: hypothetical protein IJF92_03460 [Bacilli bacterium]|nr:hypothetical protein [Bacilli bacterium]
MIQLIKNNVQYKGRTDYVVEYATIGDKQYFIKEKLNNGSFIATTNLKEAINEEMNPVSYGVMDSEGQEIISFDKKSIRSIEDKYLIVELSNPVSQAVIDMAALKNDPLATSKLVTIRADLKESVNNKMVNDEGRFEFNDPCSEATIFDYDGNNIVNNENYSYIGKGNTGFYLRKVDDEEVYKFDFATNTISNSEKQEGVPTVDLNTASVAQMPTVEEEKNEETVVSENVETPVTEEVQPEETVTNENVEIPVTEEVQPEETVTNENVEIPVTEEVQSEETVDTVDENEVDAETIKTELEDSNDSLDVSSVEVDKDELEDEISESLDISDEKENDVDAEVKNNFDNEFELSLGDYNFENEKSSFKKIEDDYNYDIEDNKKYSFDDVDDNYYDNSYSDDSVIPSAIKTIDNLFKQNKSQKEHIEQLDERNENLKGKIINYQERVEKLENKIQTLEKENHKMQDRIHDQNDIMEKQDKKIISLRESQVKQMEQQKRNEASLISLLQEVRPALNQNNDSYDNDYEYGFGRRVG